MNLAARTALLAVLLAAMGAAGIVSMTGVSWLALAGMIGLVLFGVGVFYGQGLLSTVGLATVATSTAVAAGHSVPGAAVVAAAGVAASMAMVVADSSWWLRREPDVDPAVVRGLLATLVPVWLVGAALGLGALALASTATVGLWLLPVALALTGALVAVATWATKSRHRRHDPLSDLRRS